MRCFGDVKYRVKTFFVSQAYLSLEFVVVLSVDSFVWPEDFCLTFMSGGHPV